MPMLDVLSIENKKVGEVTLSDDVFSGKPNIYLMHEAVVAALANRRLGTASTKTRGEVKGSGVKPYRQKGTGRARHGSWTSPLFRGGGIIFGPKPRDFSLHVNKKKKKIALASAIISKVNERKLVVIDKWVEKEKTKEMAKILDALGVNNALIVISESDKWLQRVVRNIPNIDIAYENFLNTYDILAHDFLVCSRDVIAKIEERLLHECV